MPDVRLLAIAEALAADLADRLDAGGLQVDMETYARFGPLLTAAVQRLVTARDNAAHEARCAALEAWAGEQGLLQRPHAQERLGLSDPEWRCAERLGLVAHVPVPLEMAERLGGRFSRGDYYRVQELTAEARVQIADATLLTRLQAAARLGITPAEFDRRRKGACIVHADTIPGSSGWPSYRYRLADVDRLACPAVSDTKERPPGV